MANPFIRTLAPWRRRRPLRLSEFQQRIWVVSIIRMPIPTPSSSAGELQEPMPWMHRRELQRAEMLAQVEAMAAPQVIRLGWVSSPPDAGEMGTAPGSGGEEVLVLGSAGTRCWPAPGSDVLELP